MEWKMWWWVLLVLVVVGMEGSGGEGSNQEVYKKLCDITRGVKGLMKNEKGNGVTRLLKEALHGKGGGEPFDNGGTFTGGSGCGLWYHGRSHYCSHIQGRDSTGNGHGCFGHSLLGTLLCLCTKVNAGGKDLCGLGVEGDGSGWSGWSSPSPDLLKEVWGAINITCTEDTTAADFGKLKRAVEDIKNQTQNKKLSGSQDGYYLGGLPNTNGPCGGSSANDACVTYPPKAGTVNEPNIPWAEKILSAMDTIIKTQHQEKSQNSAQRGHQWYYDDSSDHHTDDEEQGEEGEEESVHNSTPHNPAKKPRPKRKRDTNKQPTEQHPEPRKAILHKYDGSFLPQPFWLLSAVLI